MTVVCGDSKPERQESEVVIKLKSEYVIYQIGADLAGEPRVTVSMIDRDQFKFDKDASLVNHRPSVLEIIRARNLSCLWLGYSDYERSGIRIGDKVSLELTRVMDSVSEDVRA